MSERDPKRACVEQLVAAPPPRVDDLADQAASYLFPTGQLIGRLVLAVIASLGIGLGIAALHHEATRGRRLDPLSDLAILGWSAIVFAALAAWTAAWAMRHRRRLFRLAREGALAPLVQLETSGAIRSVAGALAKLPMPALGRGVADTVSQRPWYADHDGHRFVVYSFDRKLIAMYATPTSQLLVHPDLGIAAHVFDGRMIICRIKRQPVA